MKSEKSRAVGSLTVVGTGIKYLGHVTQETPACISQADVVIYGVSDPATKDWIRKLNPSAEPVSDYLRGVPRRRTYEHWVERILECVRAGKNVCAVFFGHPGVFVYASHESIRRARAEGFDARMLPGISAEDCLFADLGIDPAVRGCQSFEATDFLVRPRSFDTSTGLILWQISAVGRVDYKSDTSTPAGLQILVEVLVKHYGPEHPVVVYQAPKLPIFDPIVQRLPLARLGDANLENASTLYVPAKQTAALDLEMVRRLGIPEDHIEALERWQEP